MRGSLSAASFALPHVRFELGTFGCFAEKGDIGNRMLGEFNALNSYVRSAFATP